LVGSSVFGSYSDYIKVNKNKLDFTGEDLIKNFVSNLEKASEKTNFP